MEETWHSLSKTKILKILETNENGLVSKIVEGKIKKYGKNKLPDQEKLSILKTFFIQFKSPLVYILIIATAISFALKEFIDMGIILTAVLINSGIGFFQEYKAEKTFISLKKLVTHLARVLRDNQENIIKAENLVPGDIINLEAGDIVPADGRLIEVNNFQTKEAILTGESISSSKNIDILAPGTPLADRENMVYSGTIVTRGKARVVVVETGFKTELGKIASLIKNTDDDQTPLQKKIAHLAKTIGLIITALCIVLFASGLIIGRPFFEMLLISVAVAVAGIPEGLAIAVTVCLTIGMQNILKKKALTRKLIAAETLGSITVICTDKTGTLTEGKMEIAQLIPYLSKTENQDLLKIGLLCNDALVENYQEGLEKMKINGDTTEIALIKGAIFSGLERDKILKEFPRLGEIPFDSQLMYMATLHQNTLEKNKNLILIKGAPEKIINFCKLSEKNKKEIQKDFEKMTAKGFRVLGIAQKNIDSRIKDISETDLFDLEFKGLIALKDPLREQAKETIEECQKAGIRTIIITGDHPLTARTVAEEIGLFKRGDKIILGSDMDKMSDQELEKEVKKTNIFARVEPKHKIRIVDALQNLKEVVAMTGDGVNDAPAIKSADIGVALGDGSEVTKETAEVVLLDNNLKTILEAIKTGRNIFNNIKKIVLFLFSDTFTEFILIGGSLLLGLPLPILAGQILWINIIEDTLPAMALSYEKESKNILKEKARGYQNKILDKEMKFLIFFIGIITDLILVGLFIYLFKTDFDLNHIRTMIFVGLGIDTLFYVFSCKNLKKTIWHYNPFDNFLLDISVIFGWLMLLLAVYTPFLQRVLKLVPLHWSDWIALICLGLIEIILVELCKIFFIHPKINK